MKSLTEMKRMVGAKKMYLEIICKRCMETEKRGGLLEEVSTQEAAPRPV